LYWIYRCEYTRWMCGQQKEEFVLHWSRYHHQEWSLLPWLLYTQCFPWIWGCNGKHEQDRDSKHLAFLWRIECLVLRKDQGRRILGFRTSHYWWTWAFAVVFLWRGWETLGVCFHQRSSHQWRHLLEEDQQRMKVEHLVDEWESSCVVLPLICRKRVCDFGCLWVNSDLWKKDFITERGKNSLIWWFDGESRRYNG